MINFQFLIILFLRFACQADRHREDGANGREGENEKLAPRKKDRDAQKRETLPDEFVTLSFAYSFLFFNVSFFHGVSIISFKYQHKAKGHNQVLDRLANNIFCYLF